MVALALLVSPPLAAAAPGDGFEVTRYDLALTPDIENRAVAGREVITTARDRRSAPATQLLRQCADHRHGDSRRRSRRRPFPGRRSSRRPGQAARARPHRQIWSCPIMAGRRAACPARRPRSTPAISPAIGWSASRTSSATRRRSRWRCAFQPAWIRCRWAEGSPGTRAPGGGEIHRWKASRPYSAYLFGFAVGRFARAEDRVGATRLSYLSEVADAAELRRRFAETRQMVRFLSDKAGAPLPVSDYSQLLVRGRDAQEAASYAVLGVDALATTERTTPRRTGPSSTNWPINGGAIWSPARRSRTSGSTRASPPS
jgi:hypothetical protein